MNTQEAIEILERDLGDMPDCDSKEALTHAIEHMRRGAPEGWQLVPIEPIYEMQNAGKWAAFEYADGDETLEEYAADNDECTIIYKAMLSVAPQPPKEGETK